VYRRQHVFPGEPFRLLSVLCRSMLSTSMMLVYPVQTGRMHCALCRQEEGLGGGPAGGLLSFIGRKQPCFACAPASRLSLRNTSMNAGRRGGAPQQPQVLVGTARATCSCSSAAG
jgi:hypothetical protein